MLAAFLPPYPFRGTPAPYLWWYYRLLGEWSAEAAYFITGKAHTMPADRWKGRWECGPEAQARLGYRLPEQPDSLIHQYGWLDEGRFERWLASAGGNPILAFRRFLTERDASFEEELRGLLAAAPEPIEAVVTACNVPCLEAVCAQLSIPVVHVELGPLRAPLYRDTGYLDFQGVNGNTESAARYAAWNGPRPRLQREDLLAFFTQRRSKGWNSDAPLDTDLGIVLQVEDDSNLVAYGNGMDNLGILAATRLRGVQGEHSVRVRPHPGSMFAPRGDWYQLDDCADSLTFVQRCRHVLTVNSSVGVEALLLGRNVEAFGDSSFGFILEAGEKEEQLDRLAFYLLAYLVPLSMLLEPGYIRFRLGLPAEDAIIARHIEEHMRQQGLAEALYSGYSPELRVAMMVAHANAARAPLERISALEKEMGERDRQIEGFRSSASWKLTAPVRWLHQHLLRRSATR